MHIKEIAEKIRIEVLEEFGYKHRYTQEESIIKQGQERLISAYKEELLKEVGEPVLYAEFAEDGGWLGDASEYADHLEEPHALFTSDQLAAAILKATKPLEERRCEICGYAEHHREHTSCLRTQLAAAQEEIRSRDDFIAMLQETQKDQLTKAEQLWQVAQGRCDGLEEKLAKAEQRVAEAIATMFDESGTGGIYLAEMVRNSDWRKFVKEEV